MTTLQKLVKYLAIGFAIFLCLVIINTIIRGVQITTDSFDFINNKKDEPTEVENYSNYIKYDGDITYLDVDVNASNLIIKTGDELAVKTENKNIKISNENSKLKIIDKSKKIVNNKVKDLVVTIPEDMFFERVNISTGAGKVSINGINADSLEMELGAGKVEIENIYSDNTKIETGAGNVEIKNSSLNDLDLELGVGEINISAYITGNSSIESGIGALNLNLLDSSSMYKFDFEKGLGEITVNGEKITGNKVIGDGDNYIKVRGGIGSIKINATE